MSRDEAEGKATGGKRSAGLGPTSSLRLHEEQLPTERWFATSPELPSHLDDFATSGSSSGLAPDGPLEGALNDRDSYRTSPSTEGLFDCRADIGGGGAARVCGRRG